MARSRRAAHGAMLAAQFILAGSLGGGGGSEAPVNSVLPVISGTARVGQTLSCTSGTWSGSPTYEYQWKRDGANIDSATASTYDLVVADIAAVITCTVTATNDGGSTAATSDGTSAVLPLAPTNSVAPAITGTTTVGEVLTCGTGTWANTPTGYTYQWKRAGVAIDGATANTHTLISADAGSTLTCEVTASNAGGSNTASSAATATISTAEAAQFLARISAPSAPREAAYKAFIGTLVSEGIWAELDAIYLFAAADAATALTNLKSSNYGATAIGSPTFTADVGYTAASGKYIDTNFNPTTASSPNFVQNDGCVFAKTPTNNYTGPLFGYITSSTNVYIQPTSNTAFYHKINNTTNSSYATADEIGLWHANRTSSTVTKLFKDGASVHTGTANATTAPTNDKFCIGRGGGSPGAGVINLAGFGGSLTDGQIAALDTAIDTYMASL